jgi:hypothetical protein
VSSKGRLSRPKVSSFGLLRQVAARFRPAYEIEETSEQMLRIRLRDPQGRRPDLSLRHRHSRRLFFRANYLVVEADIPGRGPSTNGELAFRFRGPFSRQRASLRWRTGGGDEWIDRLEEPLLGALGDIEAIESLRIHWRARSRTWHLELETISGSMVGGFMTAMPIAVPLDANEARGVIGLVDALAASAV